MSDITYSTLYAILVNVFLSGPDNLDNLSWISEDIQNTAPVGSLVDFFLSGRHNLDNLGRIAEQVQKQAPAGAGAAEDDDNDVPELVAGETFEAAANEDQTT